VDYGEERRKVKAGEGFLTANVGFRKSSIRRFGPFDAALGRKAERWIGGEDFDAKTIHVHLVSGWLKQISSR